MVSKAAAKQLRIFIAVFQILTAIFLVLFLYLTYHEHYSNIFNNAIKNKVNSETSTAPKPKTDKATTLASTKKDDETRKRLIQTHILGEIFIVCFGIFFLLLIVAGLVLDVLYIWPKVRVEEKLELREIPTVDATVESGIDNLATSENNNISKNSARGRSFFDMFSCGAHLLGMRISSLPTSSNPRI